jgi:MATE family multidrug resistance protein
MSGIGAAPASTADSVADSTTWSGELRAGFRLAWPLIVAQLASNLLFTTDVVLMGWLGPKYLAAGTLANAFLVPFMLSGTAIVSAVAPLVAQARGRRDIKAVRRIVRLGFWVAIAAATLFLPLLLSIKPIYLALGEDPEVTDLAESYMLAGAWVLYPAFGVMVLRSFLAAFGATRVILLVTVIGVIVNGAVAYTLIFGHFGFPRLELRGAAIATGSVNVVMFAALLAYTVTHPKLHRFHILVRFWKPDWPRLLSILRIGLPIGLTTLAEVSLFSVAAILMGLLGTNEVAAHAVALQLASMAFMVPFGLGQAAVVRVGYALGRGDEEGVRKAGWTALALGAAFMSLTAATFILMPGPLVAIFLDTGRPENAAALRLAASYLAIAGIFQLSDGAQVVAAHALRGLSDTRTPMLLAIVGYWAVGMPVAWFLAFELDMRGIGIWLGLAAGLSFVALVLVARFAMRERLGLLRRAPGRS